jgi:hypothetical protein
MMLEGVPFAVPSIRSHVGKEFLRVGKKSLTSVLNL